ncbi:MAG: Glucokinase [Candidatus Dichloromethanomonas elyunquensis]|nr:MAG: Glucokinase [Candidatus Dichloromethanomonas elyunquensis]
MLLAGDIGGTKSLLALCHFQNETPVIIEEKTYSSKAFNTIEELLNLFLRESSIDCVHNRIHSACLGLAGPIRERTCQLVNLNKTIDLKLLRAAFSFIPKLTFCNDLAAVGYGLSVLPPEDLLCLTPEILSDDAGRLNLLLNKAVIAPGTGLGEVLIMGGKVYPSEGAHCEFGPKSEEEIRLWRFLYKQFGHVSYERLLSGPGLQNIYRFLVDENQVSGPSTPGFPDLQPEEISKNALAGVCPLCGHSLNLFVSILGAEAGNLALKSLSFGGIFLGGGIPYKILPILRNGTFLKSFRDKGRFSSLLESIPVYVILNSKTALLGAALIASQLENSMDTLF